MHTSAVLGVWNSNNHRMHAIAFESSACFFFLILYKLEKSMHAPLNIVGLTLSF